MSVRKIIRIDESMCDGCALCVPSCQEGAIQIVDGKARLVSETYCDGLGACLGECPRGAISLVEAGAADFDPGAVARHLRAQGRDPAAEGSRASELRQWPVQLHLVSPKAPYFKDADVLLAADCVAFAMGDFHRDYLRGRGLAIACPKLDSEQESYLEKLVAMIDEAHIASLTVMIMQVPCCRGLSALAVEASHRSSRTVPLRVIVVGFQGEVLRDEWVQAPEPEAARSTRQPGRTVVDAHPRGSPP